MSFPQSPIDGEVYVANNGAAFQYRASTNAWLITGFTGIVGATGLQGITGLEGCTGLQGTGGETGPEGSVNIAFALAGDLGWTGSGINWANAYTQQSSILVGGATGYFYFYGAETGAKGTLIISYESNESFGVTGVEWANATTPSWSAYTGVDDIISVVYNGTTYKGAATLGHAY